MSEYKTCALTFFDDISQLSGFGKGRLSVGAGAVKSSGKMHLEFRKKRPYERGKKRRKKGKRDPLSLLFNSTRDKD